MNDAPATTMAGTVLDQRYRILRPIKAGGMGTVYEGELVRLGKRVAIKVLRPEATYNEPARRRFEREAKLASRIRHRNVVELLDFGVHDDTAYYVMELLEGRDLSAVLRERRSLPWSEARPILLQVARGLAAAHRLGIIHRDVKPGNCFLVAREDDEDDDAGPRVKVLDFGIAKLDPTHATDVGVTRTSELVGTVAYMSPEQAQSQPVDGRSDVYSLGVLAYQALTGERPFQDDNVFNLLLKHVQEPPRPLRRLEPSIPEPVEAAVLQALAKEPAARFPSMDAFRAALSSVPAAVVGSATAIFVPPDVDGAATIPVRRGASLDEVRAAAGAARAPERRPSPPVVGGVGDDASLAATQVLDPAVDPLPGGTEEQPALQRPTGDTEEQRVLEPLSGDTEEQRALEPLAGGTEEQPALGGGTGNTEQNRMLDRSGATAVALGPEQPGARTAIAPAPTVPSTGSSPVSRPAPVTSAGSAPASMDRRWVAFVIAGALSLLVGVGLGVWLVQDDEGPSEAPAAPSATDPSLTAPSAAGVEAPSETAPSETSPRSLVDLGGSTGVGPSGTTARPEPAGTTGDATGGAPETGDGSFELAEQTGTTAEPDDGTEPPANRRTSKKPRAKPTDAKVQAQLVRRAKKRCAGLGVAGARVRVSLSIDPQGSITLVRLEAPHHRGELGQCVRSAVSQGKFPGTGDRRVLALSVEL